MSDPSSPDSAEVTSSRPQPRRPWSKGLSFSLLVLVGAVMLGTTVAHLTGTPLYGTAVTLMIISVALRVWLGRLPPSLRLNSSVRRRRR